MSNSGRHLAKGKPANLKPVATKDGKAVFTADECDEANSQTALARGTAVAQTRHQAHSPHWLAS